MKKFVMGICLALLAVSLVCADSAVKKWDAVTDVNDKGDSTCVISVADESIAGTAYQGVTTMKGKVTTKFKYGYIGMAAAADPVLVEALKAGKGIKFKASGDGKSYDCRVETSDRKDYCFHLFTFTAPKGKVAEIVIPYSKLKQYSWGAQKRFKTDLITNLSFQTIGQPISSVELKVWDFEIIK